MHVSRLSKRMRLDLRERQRVVADSKPGWRLAFDRPDEYVPVRDAVGFAEFDGGDDKTAIRVDLLRCCHCGRFFGVRKKGRHARCFRCDARTCGDPACDPCTGPDVTVKRFGKA